MTHFSSLGKYLSLLPALLVFALLALLPVVNLLMTSFFEVSWLAGSKQMQWVGLENYADIPADPTF